MTGKSETLLLLESLAIRIASNEQLEKDILVRDSCLTN